MEKTLRWVSPQSAPGSFFIAILAHAAIYGGAIVFLSLGLRTQIERPPVAEEIAYETFSAPPAPTKVVHHVAKTPEPQTEEKVIQKQDTTPKELQDDKGTVAGTQAAAKPQPATTGAQGDGDAATTPYYRIKPKYPRAALVSGVEGWVLMKIDITETGEVENVRIIGGEQRGMFESEARRAVTKWKYKPFMDPSGKAVRKADHQVRVDFKLTDAA